MKVSSTAVDLPAFIQIANNGNCWSAHLLAIPAQMPPACTISQFQAPCRSTELARDSPLQSSKLLQSSLFGRECL